jgi:hypothetical protein
LPLNFDVKIAVKGWGIKFYLWVNFSFSLMELISHFIFHNDLFVEKETDMFKNIMKRNTRTPTFAELKGILSKNIQVDESADINVEELNSTSTDNYLKENLVNNEQKEEHSEEPKLVSKIKKVTHLGKIIDLFDKFIKQPNFNPFIQELNIAAAKRYVMPFNKKVAEIVLNAYELDKFFQKKKMEPGFKVVINYSLLD